MKRNRLTILMVFVLLFALTLPTFAQVGDAARATAVSYHWAQQYVDQLAVYTETYFEDKDLDGFIAVEDFQDMIRLVIDESYHGAPDSAAREAVVYECARIWAEQTGQDLDQVPTIRMILYSDMDQLDDKYEQGIYVAYMKEIARGRGNRIFDPKTHTTFGELATLISLTIRAIEQESASAPQPIAEGKFETRATYEINENKVIFDFELMSHYTQPVELTFSSGQQFEITITNEEGEEVYRYSDGKFFTLALVTRTINPGESFKWQDEWDMTNKDAEKLTSGEYTAAIHILVIPEEDKLDESQFTTKINFSL